MAATGFIVMADITGYTVFLNESELEHAQDSLAAILVLIADSTQAPFIVSRFVGDAVLSYGIDDQLLNPQTILDDVENTYLAYRRALEQMVLNTTCSCNACANLGSLDLKFIIHHGEFSVQKIGEFEELMGPQINMVFRLAKNSIKEKLGFKAYVAYSQNAIDFLKLPGFAASLHSLTEQVDDFGEATIYVADMHPVWERRKAEAPVVIPDQDIWLTFSRDIRAPVGMVWDRLTDPATRSRLFDSKPGGTTTGGDGKVGVGSAYVCAHGKYRVPHRIVEWLPNQQYTFESENPHFFNVWQFRLAEIEDGTRLEVTVGKSRSTLVKKVVMGLAWKRYTVKTTRKGLDGFAAEVEKAAKLAEVDLAG